MIRALDSDASDSAAEANALALFRRLEKLSLEAVAAVQDNAGDTLLRILAERSRIMERADDLMVRVMAGSGPTSRAAAPRGPRSLIEATRRLAKLDDNLRAAIETQRDALAHDLNVLDNGGAARSAYGGKQRGSDTINVVR